MTIKETIEQMLGAIASKNYDSATEMFNNVISQKAAERLDTYKVDVADQYFNGVKEQVNKDQI